jgi:hypothetical protein
MNFDSLKNKTIKSINHRKHSKFDDSGYLDIIFTDNTKICIVGGYIEEWTGKSVNEYRTTIRLEKYGYEE